MAANGGEIVVDFTIDNGKAIVAVKQAGQTLQTLKQTLDSTASSVKKLETQNSSLSRRFRDLVLTMGNLRFVAMDVNDIFFRLPTSILKTAGELEQMQALMTGLSKEISKVAKEAEGVKSFNFVTEMAKTAPFDIKALSDSFVKFKSAGLDPTNGSMQALVDSVARFGGSGETLKRASVAIQQMVGKGVISMEELRQQLGEAVPTAMKDMADQMGLSMAELAKAIQKGTVKAEPALNKMFLRMAVNNEGAAAEMMKTWVGMTAQLKTQWDLTAKTIADSGFAVEVKRVMAELTTALASPEGRAAAIGFGHALADAVTTLVSLGKFLYEHAELIKYAAGAWATYKVATNFVAPLMTTLGNVYKTFATTVKDSAASTKMAIAQEIDRANVAREAAATRIQAAQSEANALRAAAANNIMVKRDEIAQLRAANAQMLAEQKAYQAALARSGSQTVSVQQKPGIYQMQSRQQVQTKAFDLGLAQTGNSQAILKLNAELKEMEKQHLAAGRAAALSTAELAKLAPVANTTRTAILSVATTLGGGLKTAFFAMGGWVGVAIAAVSALIGWMYKLKAASDEAAAAVARAKQDRSTSEDVTNAQKEQKTAEERLQSANKNVEALKQVIQKGGKINLDQNLRRLTAAQGEQAAATEEFNRAQAEVTKRQSSVRRQASQQEADDILTAHRVATAADREGQAQRMAELKGANANKLKELRLKGVKEDSAEWTKEVQRAAKEEASVYLGVKKKEADQTLAEANKLQAEIKALDASGQSGADFDQKRSARAQAFTALMAQYDTQIKEVGQKTDWMNQAVELGSKGKGKGGKGAGEKIYTPIQKLLAQLEADKAELDASIAGFVGDFKKFDDAGGAAAAIRKKAEMKGFDIRGTGKGAKPTPANKAEVERAAKLAEEIEVLENAQKNARKLADLGAGMEDDFEKAVASIADPLALVPKRGQAGKFADLLAKTGTDLKGLGAQLGLTGDDLTAFVARFEDLGQKLKVVDQAPRVVEMAEQTRDMMEETGKLNAEIISDEQQRVLTLAKIDADFFEKKSRTLIDYLKLYPAYTAQVEEAEMALQANLAARRAKAAKDARTPMEELADHWANSAEAMKKSTADWAEQGMDAFIQFAKTGKLEFGSLVQSILADILKIQMQKALGGAMTGTMGAIGTAVSGFFGFAKGGVMSPDGGSLPLQKYAQGGIAKSPQLALFGEGRMNEAYVPLPDGRSIPVTMKSDGADQGAPQVVAGAPSVTVNVINQTGQSVQAQQSQPRFDGEKMILDVVLSAANKPGSFRDGMKGAFSA